MKVDNYNGKIKLTGSDIEGLTLQLKPYENLLTKEFVCIQQIKLALMAKFR